MYNTRGYKDSDFDSVCEFLGRIYQTDRKKPYWLPGRWEYATYLVSPLYLSRGKPDWKEYIRIWEDASGRIIAIVNSENPDANAYLHLDKDHRHLEEEMLKWAEEHIAVPDKKSRQTVLVWAIEGDTYRENLLQQRGYNILDGIDYLKWQSLDSDFPGINLPGEFSITSFAEGVNPDSRFQCAAKAFNSEPISRAIYKITESAPSYRANLDICIVNQDKEVVSLCTVWFDKSNRLGYFEPVATHPDYQGKGLGRAVLTEGLQRLRKLGAQMAYVGAYGDENSAFYSGSGFTDSVAHRKWVKYL
ncbi:MAG: GNAT family N-acetyltransferase [Candidatus Marinimicrobia bacterium]|nr:GNAT family N-acetyltransferase [Candidatus Neomarinimicrobiota bacterium]